jgi:arginine-tRNA-protein transferase
MATSLSKGGYLSWDQVTITDFSTDSIARMYEKGYVLTRIGKGVMVQTRSVRIKLSDFSLSSENRRILKKTDGLKVESVSLPFQNYDYTIGKIAKDFYDTKFGTGTMSAQKIKEMLTSPDTSNFNALLLYTDAVATVGYAISYQSPELLHYSYPFYDLPKSSKDMGLGMMIRAIELAKLSGLTYMYLGSLQNHAGLYKLQFSGLEWFDGAAWSTDLEKVKKILAENVADKPASPAS